MSIVVSFHDYTPVARYDNTAWQEVTIEETDDPVDGTWTLIDTIALDPVDADPADPAARSFTTPNGTAANLWYRITFVDALGRTTIPTDPIQDAAGASYATVTELARILKLRTPTTAQEEAMLRVLAAAAGEIRAELDLASTDYLEGWELELCAQVNLDRAADLWRHTESIPGVLGSLDETLASQPVRYSWERYAQRLAPAKRQWGLA